ncbi:hypothetical protein LOTGIDRAFT_69624, partial [Lottia gigantea]
CPNESKWTEWFDRDNQEGTGDHETIRSLNNQYHGRLCTNPTSLDVRLLNGSNYHVGGNVLILSPSIGFKCINKYQSDGICKDYQVRFCC